MNGQEAPLLEMDSSTMLFLGVYAAILVVGIIAFIIYKRLKTLQKRGVIKTTIREYIFLNLFQRYDKLFLTTDKLNMIKKNVQSMCVYTVKRHIYSLSPIYDCVFGMCRSIYSSGSSFL